MRGRRCRFAAVVAFVGLLAACAIGCASLGSIVVNPPDLAGIPAADAQAADRLFASRLHGATVRVHPIRDVRNTEPDYIGREESAFYRLSKGTVAGLVQELTASSLTSMGLHGVTVSANPPSPDQDFCTLDMTVSIHEAWVLADPMTEKGVAESYYYTLSLTVTVTSSDGTVLLKDAPLQRSVKTPLKSIDPFFGEEMELSKGYYPNIHTKALENLFSLHLADALMSDLWQVLRAGAYCPGRKDDPRPL